MIPRIKKAAKVLLGRDLARRSVTVYPDDVFITSYPKSGNTWVRFLIANLIWPDGSTDFTNIEDRIPDIYINTDGKLMRMPRPRFLKSHEYFDPRYPKVLYIIRDPRSVLVSYYYYEIKMGRIHGTLTISDFFELFVKGKINPYGSWKENVLSWLAVMGRETDRFRLLRYEDLKSNGPDELKEISEFIGIHRTENEIIAAFQASALEKMKVLEVKAGRSWQENKKARKSDIPFIRSGRVDEWRSMLDSDILDRIQSEWGSILKELGYD